VQFIRAHYDADAVGGPDVALRRNDRLKHREAGPVLLPDPEAEALVSVLADVTHVPLDLFDAGPGHDDA
jgi:hypothetical protein